MFEHCIQYQYGSAASTAKLGLTHNKFVYVQLFCVGSWHHACSVRVHKGQEISPVLLYYWILHQPMALPCWTLIQGLFSLIWLCVHLALMVSTQDSVTWVHFLPEAIHFSSHGQGAEDYHMPPINPISDGDCIREFSGGSMNHWKSTTVKSCLSPWAGTEIGKLSKIFIKRNCSTDADQY